MPLAQFPQGSDSEACPATCISDASSARIRRAQIPLVVSLNFVGRPIERTFAVDRIYFRSAEYFDAMGACRA